MAQDVEFAFRQPKVHLALVMCLTALWVTVAARTAHAAWHGHLFAAPR